jgi:nucleotide-binding universal stress UspA family protein
MKTILAPTDFSPSSLNAVYYAADLAVAINARLVILHAIPFPMAVSETSVSGDFIDDLMEMGNIEIDELHKNILDRTGNKISVTRLIKIGPVEQEIEFSASNERPLAIVMGIRSGKTPDRALMGSSIFHVMNHVGFPTLIVPENAQFTGIKQIGMACDFKKADDELPFEAIQEWLTLFKAKLEIINVAARNSDFKTEQLSEAISLQNRLNTFRPNFHFLTGDDIADELNEFINTHPLDLLMVFPRKHGAIKLFYKKKSKKIVTRNLIPILSMHDVI